MRNRSVGWACALGTALVASLLLTQSSTRAQDKLVDKQDLRSVGPNALANEPQANAGLARAELDEEMEASGLQPLDSLLLAEPGANLEVVVYGEGSVVQAVGYVDRESGSHGHRMLAPTCGEQIEVWASDQRGEPGYLAKECQTIYQACWNACDYLWVGASACRIGCGIGCAAMGTCSDCSALNIN